MNIHRDDPRWTAYALDEMSAEERVAFESEMGDSAEAQGVLEEIRQTSQVLEAGFAEEQALIQPSTKLVVFPQSTPIWQQDWLWNAGVAALFIVCAGAFFMMLQNTSDNVTAIRDEAQAQERLLVLGETPELRIQILQDVPQQPSKGLQMPVRPVEAPASWVNVGTPGQEYKPMGINREGTSTAVASAAASQGPSVVWLTAPASGSFLNADSPDVSLVPVEAGGDSYAHIARSLEEGKLPAPEMVKLNHLAGAFPLEGTSAQAVDTDFETDACPWAPNHLLVRFRVPFDSGAAVGAVFNADRVSRYRLIGTSQDGHSLVALYEVVPIEVDQMAAFSLEAREGGAEKNRSKEILRIKSKVAEDDLSSVLHSGETHLEPSQDFRFSAAVAAFGMRLRGDGSVDHYSYDRIAALAESALGDKPSADRMEFVALVRKASTLEAQR